MFLVKTFQRSFHTATAANYVRRKANPGIGIQTQVFQRENIVKSEEDFDDLEEMDSDFMHVHKSHKDHEAEMEAYREKMRHWVVKNKYFKEKLPNFLTYAEKEQIKLLNARDPEEWTAEKLAESFPANPEIIQQIIRTKWTARSEKRIKDHDKGVMENWESLRQGGFSELNALLREHLTKFASRRKEDLQNLVPNWTPRPALPRPKRTDFLSIITSCKGYADKEPIQKMLTDAQAKEMSKVPSAEDEETYISDKVKDKRKMRLQELKALKLKDTADAVPSALPFDNNTGTGIVQTNNAFILDKYASDEIIVSSEDVRKFEMAKVKDRIYIPRKLRKKGATYKVEDCYYDDDGEFLYRVPGMTGKRVG